jgi:hypothetical protein
VIVIAFSSIFLFSLPDSSDTQIAHLPQPAAARAIWCEISMGGP